MTSNTLPYVYSSHLPPSSNNRSTVPTVPVDQKNPRPPRKPDWLLVIIGVLFLLTLFIAWLADIPGLLR